MALKEKVSSEDVALLEIVEDPVWLGEFLRNTANGESNKELWPKGEEFKYRNYQREWLTDSSPYVCVTAGRAVGKCQLVTDRIYTDRGYKTIAELNKLPSFYAYALNSKNELVLRRAKVYPNKSEQVYEVITYSGKKIHVNKDHPFLTPNGDWVKIKDLTAGDLVAVSTKLPELTNKYYFEWHELRWLGYALFQQPTIGPETKIKLRFKKQVAEMRLIAKKFNQYLVITDDRIVQIKRRPKQAYLRNNVTWLLYELGYSAKINTNGMRRLPPQLMELPNEPLKVFLEALFSQYATLSLTDVSITYPWKSAIYQVQELLLRFGIESRIDKAGEIYTLSLLDTRAIYRFYTTFTLPGVSVQNVPLPPNDNDSFEHLRYDAIKSITPITKRLTYAVYVYEHHNYISNDLYVHNSLVLEDKTVWEIINADKEFPVTKEQLLTTANQAQLNPILDRLITRFSNGKLLQSFLQNQVNKSQGTMKFPTWNFIFTARIAAGKGESNLVGLHLPRIKIDEAQLFSNAAYTQLIPSLNQWEPKTQVMVTGVPNGLRNTILYQSDQRLGKYKKYRIPSHNNPYYTKQDDTDNIKRYGGESADEYQNLVLGRHGAAAEQVLGPDSIKRQSYDFYSYRYTQNNRVKGETFQQVFNRQRLPEGLVAVYVSIDPGFVDPTVINIWGKDKKGVWRCYARYRTQRIDYPEVEKIIDWLDDEYHFTQIGIDIGAGGNGASLLQGLCSRAEYKHKQYERRTIGINFGEGVVVGRNDTNNSDIKKDVKAVGTEELIRRIEDAEIIFSEIDAEGTSELEKIAKQRGINGVDKYFIMSDSGKGKSGSDHHYASCVVFAMMIRDSGGKKKKRLGRSFNG